MQISAVVYLADGQECRSVQLSPKSTVEDLIAHMLEARGDWEERSSDGTLAAREGTWYAGCRNAPRSIAWCRITAC